MKKYSMLITLFTFFLAVTFANAATVATGGKDGFYNNGLFNTFNAAVKRMSGDELELERFADKGTDGTKQNLKLVDAGKADIAFVQLGGTVLEDYGNVEVIGIVMYELAHLAVPKKGKVGKCGDLESKKGHSVGMNLMSGSAVTWAVMSKEDKGYKKASQADFTKGTKAISAMTRGDLDSYFFVSGPRTKNISRITNSADIKFGSCWDGDFDDFKVNGKQLYTKVKVGKKEGYPNNFTTFRVPAVVVANKDFLAENDDVYDYLFDATSMTYTAVQGKKKLKYYPKK